MMENATRKPSLDRPANYEIRVPGRLGENWSDWIEGITIRIESQEEGPPFTILTGSLDQAALQGLLRRLYALGLPLVSVICLECVPETGSHSSQNRKERERK